ncbi:MAG: hypothetical protein ACOCYP_04640 [Planctomycetota bacterium]
MADAQTPAPDPDATPIWYAAYGPDLLWDCMERHLGGGELEPEAAALPGCADPTPPIDERALLIPHRLYFAGRARHWADGGDAFIDPTSGSGVTTFGRAWRVSRSQLVDLIRSKNGRSNLAIDLEALLASGSVCIAGKTPYGRLLRLADLDGLPVIACCSPRPFRPSVARPPSHACLGTLIAGLRETFNLGANGVRSYLKDVPGVAGHYSGNAIERIHAETGTAEDA